MLAYFFQKATWPPFVLAAKFFLYFKVEGGENFKLVKQRQYFIIANHRGYLDAFLVCSAVPFFYFIKSDFRYMIAPHWLKVYPFLKLFGAYPIYRKSGNLEKTLADTEKLIKHGKSLLIFPEGTFPKDNKPLPAKQGIAYLAKKYDLPIVPMAIHNGAGLNPKRYFLRKHKIKIKIGPPFYYQEVADAKDDYCLAAQKIMNKVNLML